METIRGESARAQVDALTADAVGRAGIPVSAARQAAGATLRWLDREAPADTEHGRRRVSAYFWGVVRRRALAGGRGLTAHRVRCVADALAADMLAAGHDPSAVAAELAPVVGMARATQAAGTAVA